MFHRQLESVVLFLALVFVASSPHLVKGAESGADRAGKRSLPQPIPEGISADLKEQIENLYSSDRKTRADAAGRLGAMKERARSATPYLVDVLKNDEAWDVRMWAATALAMTKDAKALKPLIDSLKDEGGIVRETGSFSNFFDKQVTRRDVQHYVRRFAAYALGELGDKEAVKPLAGVLRDEDPEVRAFAADALQKIGDKEATTSLKEAVKKEEHKKAKQAMEQAIAALESAGGATKPSVASHDCLLQVVDAKRLDPHFKKALGDILGDDADAEVLLVTFALQNNGEHTYRLGLDDQMTIGAAGGSAQQRRRIRANGLLVQPFALPKGATLEAGGKWFAWYNVAAATEPDYGTHLFLPMGQFTLGLAPGGKCELAAVFRDLEPGKLLELEITALPPAKIDVVKVQDREKDAAAFRSAWPAGGARNFVPREIPGGGVDAIKVDGLPVLSMQGHRWRAKKGAAGPGLIYFRQRGESPESIPFGGAGKFATEVEW